MNNLFYTLILREKQEKSQVKEKFEAIVYGLRDGEMKVRKTEPSDQVFIIALDQKDAGEISVTNIGIGKASKRMFAKPLAVSVTCLLKNSSDDPKTVAHLMSDFREVLEEECAEYMLQHFAEIFGEAE